MVDQGPERATSYLMVTMGGRRCGVPAQRVIKVLRRASIQAFPAREPAFLGLARYSSEAVAVFDGATFFGFRESPGPLAAEPVVVMVHGATGEQRESFGLLVEEVDRLVPATEAAAGAGPEGIVVCDPARSTADRGRNEA